MSCKPRQVFKKSEGAKGMRRGNAVFRRDQARHGGIERVCNNWGI